MVSQPTVLIKDARDWSTFHSLCMARYRSLGCRLMNRSVAGGTQPGYWIQDTSDPRKFVCAAFDKVLTVNFPTELLADETKWTIKNNWSLDAELTTVAGDSKSLFGSVLFGDEAFKIVLDNIRGRWTLPGFVIREDEGPMVDGMGAGRRVRPRLSSGAGSTASRASDAGSEVSHISGLSGTGSVGAARPPQP